MAKIYIGSSLLNADQVKSLIGRFTASGVSITYDWTQHGRVYDEQDLMRYGEAEYRGVVESDLFFMVQPARTGTHVEMGIALALNKPIVLVNDRTVEQKTFYYLPNVHRFESVDDAFDFTIRKLS